MVHDVLFDELIPNPTLNHNLNRFPAVGSIMPLNESKEIARDYDYDYDYDYTFFRRQLDEAV